MFIYLFIYCLFIFNLRKLVVCKLRMVIPVWYYTEKECCWFSLTLGQCENNVLDVAVLRLFLRTCITWVFDDYMKVYKSLNGCYNTLKSFHLSLG